ncbi:MAG: DNA mismatch repair endonuclease MutL [candidate division Zixibacteria bacterium]|nr:DNA mismatch repair endonuclease MutL [candidate division Zixibacteria bacterium]
MTDKDAVTTKRWIRPLPERLINKIAAGEVIERPAAVLKELVENSLDAGATRIDITVEKSGTKSIIVADNGCGIDPDQIEIAFGRHATSKINNFDDLEHIASFGFRGEALPSVASVSRTRMVSKTAAADSGREIIVEAGVVQSVKPVAAPIGTTVEVANLFFNTPARKKFLKSEATESQHLTRNATALALSAPQAGFSYMINGRKLFTLTDQETDRKTRTARLLLGNNADQLFGVQSASEGMHVSAFLSYPMYCRRNQTGLYVFINNRYIRSQVIVHGVTSGYAELLERGHYPVGTVFITVDPAQVDVNVHPTKAEVRLSDERRVHDILHQAVKRSLREAGELPTPHVVGNATSIPHGFTVSEAVRRLKTAEPARSANDNPNLLRELYRDQAPPEPQSQSVEILSSAPEIESGQPIQTSSDHGPFDPERARYLGQFGGLYLLFSSGDNLFVVDQHAAHERILYEETLRVVDHGGAASQNLLFPVTIDLPADQYALYEEASEVLTASGFIVEPFGPRTVMLSAVPSALSRQSPEMLFVSIISDVGEHQRAGFDIKKSIAQSMACRASIMSGDKITEDEARALVVQLSRTENRHTCPHGRPITLKISRYELDVKFGRK